MKEKLKCSFCKGGLTEKAGEPTFKSNGHFHLCSGCVEFVTFMRKESVDFHAVKEVPRLHQAPCCSYCKKREWLFLFGEHYAFLFRHQVDWVQPDELPDGEKTPLVCDRCIKALP